MFPRLAALVLSAERQEQHPADVDCGQQHSGQRRPEDERLLRPRLQQDLVLAPEAGQREQAHQRHPGYRRRREGNRHVARQAAHLPHVERTCRVVHGAGAQEQQRLEEGVREQVEDRRHDAADAQPHHHVAELADRGVGHHPLDVRGHDPHRRPHDRRDGPYRGDGVEGIVRGGEHGEQPRHQVNARRDHRRGVDQRRDRRRALHRVRQPHVQRELRRLPRRPREDPQREPRHHARADRPGGRHLLDVRDA